MKFVADLHLHSKYSRAVSQNMTLPNMAEWAAIKGIDVIATGDFTHPFWFDHLKTEMEDAGNGLFRLKAGISKSPRFAEASRGEQFPISNKSDRVYFLLSCEISSIYSQGGKGRRIHNLFIFPSIVSVEKFNNELIKRRVNLRSDGRPIVGISSRDLAEIALTIDERCLVIPAHIWTPWFSLFGSFSGFDSIGECFGDMAESVLGVETGLSSDPAMNWQIKDLDRRAILSFSDAHSLEKMGREATVFEAEEISYDAIYDAISSSGKLGKLSRSEDQSFRKSDKQSLRSSQAAGLKSDSLHHRDSESSEYSEPKIAFTMEFYPEEGKYHFTGHRNCNVSLTPEEAKLKNNKCPVCFRDLTVGVLDRVEELKTRNSKLETRNRSGVNWIYPDGVKRPSFVSLVPLYEIIAEAFNVGTGTQKVRDLYFSLVSSFGSEFNVLLKTDTDKIMRAAGQKIAEGIDKVRKREIVIEAGYDGKFGVVKIWGESGESEKNDESQLNLFA